MDTVQAVLLNAHISALVVTGNVVATALKTSFASEALVHVYSTTWQRLDATVAMLFVQSCKNHDEAAEHIRTRAVPFTPVPVGRRPCCEACLQASPPA